MEQENLLFFRYYNWKYCSDSGTIDIDGRDITSLQDTKRKLYQKYIKIQQWEQLLQ